MARIARTFRITLEANELLKEAGKRLKENDTVVLIRAIEFLHANLKPIVEKDTEARLSGLK